MSAKLFNTDTHKIIDHHVYVLCGDGCLQEGVSAEAMSFAAHEKLDNLILLFDSNDVTLDRMAKVTQSEDHAMRFMAYGWDVRTVTDGHDVKAIQSAIDECKVKNGRPKAIILKTMIGKGIDEVAGKTAAHGEGGVKFVEESKKKLGLPEDKWYVSSETKSFFAERKNLLKKQYDQWGSTFASWKASNPDLAKILKSSLAKERKTNDEILSTIPFSTASSEATRQSGSTIINHISTALPTYVSGSADLHGSTKNYITNGGNFGSGEGKSYSGKNFLFGIREHAMGGICNGLAYGGIFTPSCSTFLVFADYMRPAIRLAALSELPVSYILTHDSIGVGEDGPTHQVKKSELKNTKLLLLSLSLSHLLFFFVHQPVETVSSLRVFPNLDVMRPADYEETAAAYVHSITRTNGPTALILTRQNVPLLDAKPEVKRQGTLRGAYVLRKETSPLTHILMASGSEVQLALAAAIELGSGARVVSMPCMSLFDKQTAEYKESVIPSQCRKRVAIEAGVSGLWHKYVGLDGKVLGVDRFGFSAPASITMRELKMTVADAIAVAKSLD
jgi:transketolase